jgi:hypothetical protein
MIPHLTSGSQGNITASRLLGVEQLLLNIEAQANVGRSIWIAGCTGGKGIYDVIANVGEFLSHGIQHHDSEEIVFLGYANRLDAMNEVLEGGTSGRESLGMKVLNSESLLNE